MTAHRFFGEGKIDSVQRPAPSGVTAEGFVVCPLPLRPPSSDANDWMHEVYRLAYEQARACVARPWHERNLVACLN